MLCRFNFLILFCHFISSLSAQSIQQLHLKKDPSAFYFFQKGKASDTIVANKTDVFYLLLSDSLKQKLIIEIENAQLVPDKNDSLVLLKYVPGINYLNKFIATEGDFESLETIKKRKNKWQMIMMINGANHANQHKIRIQFIDAFSKKTFAEFIYFTTKN